VDVGTKPKVYDPIPPVAEEIAETTWLLCFDEFQVKLITLFNNSQQWRMNELFLFSGYGYWGCNGSKKIVHRAIQQWGCGCGHQ
jgi:hypothetical protein